MDIRLKTQPFNFDGKTFQLCCNMNVLADVQSVYEGNIRIALESPDKVRSLLEFLTAMLNDYADSQNWEERYTSRQVGRLLKPSQLNMISETVMGLVVDSIKDESDTEEEAEKN